MNPSVKVAQPGWDANTCPDWALIFNSNWPSLQIAFETTVLPGENTFIPHNLGFPPLTMAWVTFNGISYGRVTGLQLEVDQANIYLFPNTDELPGTIVVRCFNIDISKDASYPLPAGAAAKQPPDLTTSIKIVKPDRAITSPNLNDFILNSQAQSPAILDIATERGQYYDKTSGELIYPLQTSYIPWVLAAVNVNGYPDLAYSYYEPTSLSYNATNNTLTTAFESGSGSLIVLRDPLFYPNVVRVVY